MRVIDRDRLSRFSYKCTLFLPGVLNRRRDTPVRRAFPSFYGFYIMLGVGVPRCSTPPNEENRVMVIGIELREMYEWV
jgi:hypothetical protein